MCIYTHTYRNVCKTHFNLQNTLTYLILGFLKTSLEEKKPSDTPILNLMQCKNSLLKLT